jgi:Uma2 family endonuclease
VTALPDDLHRTTVDEYTVLADLSPDAYERTELIDGVIYNVSPEGSRHQALTHAVYEGLKELCRKGEKPQMAGTPRFDDGTMFAPDAYITFDDEWAEGYIRPDTITLAVEVSLTTKNRDAAKIWKYAAAGVPEVWIVTELPGGAPGEVLITRLTQLKKATTYAKSEVLGPLNLRTDKLPQRKA